MSASNIVVAVATGLMLLTAGLFFGSLLVGPVPVELNEVWAAILDKDESAITTVIQEIRLPRSILAIAIGASLGLSGAALQSLVRNPLAEPGIIGVSALSALGAVTVFYSGFASAHPLALPIGGIAGALVSVIVLLALAGRGLNTLTLILAGVAINSLGGALTALVLNLSPNPFAAYEIFFWLMGSLANRSFNHVWLVLPFSLIGWLLILSAARALDAFVLGEEVASSLSVNIKRTRLLVVIGSSLSVGAGVAVAGIIGFVGLVVPHLLRPVVGYRPVVLVPLSGLGGACLTLAADLSSRVGIGHTELMLGVVTSLIGAPFFLYLVIRTRSESM
ncbi:MAG TPA: ABC transporter permease [Gammaproteobacteria bacterium]|nr:ABC transporter permease [Gammaproteobacteria bacterium]